MFGLFYSELGNCIVICWIIRCNESNLIRTKQRLVVLETDSILIQFAFKSPSLVPYGLRNRWDNCLEVTRHMNVVLSHVIREINCCADKLANFGLSTNSYKTYELHSFSYLIRVLINYKLFMDEWRTISR